MGNHEREGVVFDIQRFSIHDGPGIRTTVFLKGCPLRCKWCQNPEGLHIRREIQFFENKCIMCKKCFNICPEDLHRLENGLHVIKREGCMLCGKCVNECYSGALRFSAEYMTVDEIMEAVSIDKVYYDLSGGGVTISGGDPLFQCSFTLSILKECKSRGINTAIETSGHGKWQDLKKLVDHSDIVFIDLKLYSNIKHREFTGVDNSRILKNIIRLDNLRKPFIVRTPIVPGVNDNETELQCIADFIKKLTNVMYWEWIPYHRLGESKYRALGLDIHPFSKDGMLNKQILKELASKIDFDGIELKL
ncbi:MAG: glycyl-radical enzyme activating protein [Firmicutes bacterium]|nr:glycyl-radical enzyme activating protein [Bacillota bacterium]